MEESAWPPPAITRGDGGLTLGTTASILRTQLDPFRLTWLRPDGRVFLADRPSMAWMLSRRGTAVAHYLARRLDDRCYGPGDKTGPLDLHGRRLRIAMRDAQAQIEVFIGRCRAEDIPAGVAWWQDGLAHC